jgi:hypothetical protein
MLDIKNMILKITHFNININNNINIIINIIYYINDINSR